MDSDTSAEKDKIMVFCDPLIGPGSIGGSAREQISLSSWMKGSNIAQQRDRSVLIFVMKIDGKRKHLKNLFLKKIFQQISSAFIVDISGYLSLKEGFL